MPRLLRAVFKQWSRRWAAALVIAVLLGCVALAFAPSVYHRLKPTSAAPPASHAAGPRLQGQPTAKPAAWQAQLGLQPEADRFRRRVGQRFLKPGREVATLIGTLKLGAQQYTARITRSQEDDGESLTIGLNGGPASLTWNSKDGSKSSGSPAIGDQRSLIERLVLDSPDQFVLAQLRGATYYTVAKNARPAEAKGNDKYAGPIWDIVRLGEPSNFTTNKPQSSWRQYLLNSSTGLIEKVLSQEDGQTVTAEFSGWVTLGGETTPTHITWKQNDKVVMELTLSNLAFSAKQ